MRIGVEISGKLNFLFNFVHGLSYREYEGYFTKKIKTVYSTAGIPIGVLYLICSAGFYVFGAGSRACRFEIAEKLNYGRGLNLRKMSHLVYKFEPNLRT